MKRLPDRRPGAVFRFQTDPGGPSVHLTWQALSCRNGSRAGGSWFPRVWRKDRGALLGRIYEDIIVACGGVVPVVAVGYRTPAWNTVLTNEVMNHYGGKGKPQRPSQHVFGRALDLLTPDGFTADAFYAALRNLATQPGSPIRGLGLYPWGVHVDVRVTGRLIEWRSDRPWPEPPVAKTLVRRKSTWRERQFLRLAHTFGVIHAQERKERESAS